ncbi:hypothetical protein QBC32DRAFT_365540 [Pseudoneurospora amorphoporcata]|uniref:Uncharacterized protein n=1 Tax=Pseudoneurospora amorphoporcata TaxID=241081 RepID=A0AAN6SB58_9PEZI|nr:hypothetical protein QBC32DRAFT_365540 [Pseudoneurospora amorphoporcata]
MRDKITEDVMEELYEGATQEALKRMAVVLVEAVDKSEWLVPGSTACGNLLSRSIVPGENALYAAVADVQKRYGAEMSVEEIARVMDGLENETLSVVKYNEVVEKFNEFIGERKLKDWKKLCDTIGLEGEFESIQSCREAIEAVHVNIYDVLDADEIIQAGGKARPQRFSTPYELSEYTKRAEKIYPRWMVIRSEPEGALLKNINNPRLDEEWQRKKDEKKMRRKKEARVKREQKLNNVQRIE